MRKGLQPLRALQMIKMDWDNIYKKHTLKEIPWHSEKPPYSLIKSIKEVKKGLALDVCCGAGTNSIFLAKNGFEVKGIDISKKAIEIARSRAKKENVNIHFKAGNVLSLKNKNQFDFIFDRGCFHHMPKSYRSRFIKKIYAALKKNGRYHLMAFSKRNNFELSLSEEDIHKYFSEYFDIGRIEEEVHKEPDNNKVYLSSALMTKIGGIQNEKS